MYQLLLLLLTFCPHDFFFSYIFKEWYVLPLFRIFEDHVLKLSVFPPPTFLLLPVSLSILTPHNLLIPHSSARSLRQWSVSTRSSTGMTCLRLSHRHRARTLLFGGSHASTCTLSSPSSSMWFSPFSLQSLWMLMKQLRWVNYFVFIFGIFCF